MRRTLKEWLVVLVSLLDDIVAVAVVLLILWLLRIPVPPWLMVMLALMAGGLTFLVGKLVIPAIRRKVVTGAEGMVGMECVVLEPLKPHGAVRVKGECWQAQSVNGTIEAGTRVEITAMNGLVLRVKRKG